ncbi:hypothetical protein ACFV0G_39505, partial [Kitasatospora sp. NPDC059571]
MPALQQGPRTAPQRHVPAVQRPPQGVGERPEGRHLVLGGRVPAGLQQRDQPQAAAQQLQGRVRQSAGQPDHLVGPGQPLPAVVGAGAGVAERGERRAERGRVAGTAGEPHRLLGERDPLLLRFDEGARHRQPCGDRGQQRRPALAEQPAGLGEQVELLPVEQGDLEADRSGAEPECGPGQQVGAAAGAGERGGAQAGGPRGGGLAGAEPGGGQGEMEFGEIGGPVAGVGPGAAAVPVGGVLEGQQGGRPVAGQPGLAGGRGPVRGARAVSYKNLNLPT